jgi:hypothetical protein
VSERATENQELLFCIAFVLSQNIVCPPILSEIENEPGGADRLKKNSEARLVLVLAHRLAAALVQHQTNNCLEIERVTLGHGKKEIVSILESDFFRSARLL